MVYRTSFFLGILSRFLAAFRGIIAISFLFSGFEHIKGYSYTDILLCYAIIEMSFAISECISSGFASFASMVKSGRFDIVLIRPRGPILQVLGMGFEMERFGAIISAAIALGIVFSHRAIEWTCVRVLTLMMMLAGGTTLFTGLFILGATICFFAIEESSALNLFTYGGKNHGKYPIDVYGKDLFKFCTYIIPYTLIQYYLLQYLLERSDNPLLALCPLGACVFLLVAHGLWRVGLRRYTSCGS